MMENRDTLERNPMKPLYEEHNRPIRRLLRFLGFVLTPIGVIFTIIGLIDFFAVFGGETAFPTKFWYLFIGLPLTFAGIACLQAGYLKTIGKYVAGESVPVVTESVRYTARELRPAFREYAQDLKSTQGDGSSDPVERMKKLEELKEKGLISEFEYETKRSDIIQKL